jgi:hypothetical protein
MQAIAAAEVKLIQCMLGSGGAGTVELMICDLPFPPFYGHCLLGSFFSFQC